MRNTGEERERPRAPISVWPRRAVAPLLALSIGAIIGAPAAPRVNAQDGRIITIPDSRDGVIQCGSYAVAWSTPPGAFSSHIEATDSEGSAVFDADPEVIDPTYQYTTPLWCGDLLGDGTTVLAYQPFATLFCCPEMVLVLLDDVSHEILPTNDIRAAEPQQLDDTPPLELVGVKTPWEEVQLGIRFQPGLPAVFAYDGTSYVEATRRYPAFLRARLMEAQARLDTTRDQATAVEVLGLYILLGQGDQGLAAVKARVSRDVAAWLDANAAPARRDIARHYGP